MYIIFILLLLCIPAQAELRKAPDGTWVDGTPRVAPDGTWVGGTPRVDPNGTWHGTGNSESN